MDYEMTANSFFVSIIIPVYNSENTIELVCRDIFNSLKNEFEFEIILVNDRSTDNSYGKCNKLSENHKNIIFINLSKNFGQHNAIFAGLKFSKGDYIVFMDDDLQTPPIEIKNLVMKINEGFDVVYANYRNKKHSKIQNIGSKINDIMSNVLLKKPKNLRITSFFIIRRFIANEILKYEGPYPYLGGLVLRSTDNIGITYVEHKKRISGETGYSFLKLLKLWLNGYTNFSVKPLRVSFFLGAFISIVSFILAVLFIIRKIINPEIFMGWTSIIVVLLFFSGIQLVITGFIGEYIGRIFLSLNKQPQYIIKEIINYKKDE